MITTIDAYVAAVGRALGPGAHAAELTELRSQLQELAAAHGEAGACRIMGDPREYAAAIRGEGCAAPETDDDVPHIFGVPFTGLQDPRLGLRRVFDPTNPKILVPKIMGYGWTVNWGAVAVKLRILRPDDVDASVLRRVRVRDVALACVVPVTFATAGLLIAHWGATHLGMVPNHWATGGRVDRWGPANKVLWPSIVATSIIAGLLAVAALVLTRLRLAALGLGAVAAATMVVGCGLVMTIARVVSPSSIGVLMTLGIFLAFFVGFLVGVIPLRLALQRTWADSRTGLIQEGRR